MIPRVRKVASKIAGGQEFSQLDFNVQAVKVFDNIRALTPDQWKQVSQTLQLSFDPNVIDSIIRKTDK